MSKSKNELLLISIALIIFSAVILLFENNGNDIKMIENSESVSQIQENGRININTCDKDMLMSIDGISEIKANNIIKYRYKVRRFTNIDELKKVEGIGDKTFEKIKAFIYIK